MNSQIIFQDLDNLKVDFSNIIQKDQKNFENIENLRNKKVIKIQEIQDLNKLL